MSVGLYFDNNAPARIAEGLRRRGVDVVRAVEDGRAVWPDEQLLERATQLGRSLYTQDDDFLAITARWSTTGREFAGLAFSVHRALPIGTLVEDLELIAKVFEPADVRSESVPAAVGKRPLCAVIDERARERPFLPRFHPARQENISIGALIDEIDIIARLREPEKMASRIEFVPFLPAR